MPWAHKLGRVVFVLFLSIIIIIIKRRIDGSQKESEVGSNQGASSEDDFLWDTFPDGFHWGTATSAYQIEGGWNEDGKGESIWDRFCHKGGSVNNNETGDVACDSYHLQKTDISMIKNLGVHFYRFSISWPRILPDGTLSVVSEAGIDYYNRLIDGLLAEGIQPMVTLYHWDLPQALEDNGGWLNTGIVKYFNDYARLCFQRFGDRVKFWITINEPYVVSWGGYGFGVMAPGIKKPEVGAYEVAHNLIKAHAKAWHTYDKEFRGEQKGKISIALSSAWHEPFSTKADDIEAADRATEFLLGWFAHPIFVNGDYPLVMKDYIGRKSKMEGRSASRLPEFTDAEKEWIARTYDFFAINHYTTSLIENHDNGVAHPGWKNDQDTRTHVDSSWPSSGCWWLKEVPWGMRKLLKWIKDHYNNPEVLITENGISDDAEHHGSLNDRQRIRYLANYINNVLKAIKLDGCKVSGYTLWSLMDNFEWREGYAPTFGLHLVNFTDPARSRTPKDSARFYRQLIYDNGWPKT